MVSSITLHHDDTDASLNELHDMAEAIVGPQGIGGLQVSVNGGPWQLALTGVQVYVEQLVDGGEPCEVGIRRTDMDEVLLVASITRRKR